MNNNFRVVFYLRGMGYTTKDGKTPIQLRIYLGKERKSLGNTGYSIDKKYWDAKSQCVNSKSAEARFINSQLKHIETDFWRLYRKYEFSDELSLERIGAEYLGKNEHTETVLAYYDNFINMRMQEIGHGLTPASIQKYKVVRRHFGEYLEKRHCRKDLNFAELNYSIISGFEHFLRTEEECQNNTVMRMLRTFKTVIINATKEGLLSKDPFLGVRIHFNPVDRGFLNESEIKRLMQAEFSVKRLEHVRDTFVFSCFTGLAYIDIANLIESDIMTINGKPWIVRRRQKTKVDSHVPLLDIPLMLIKKYKGTAKNGHVFPVMSNQKTNAYLKEIADLCGIQKKLTCHLARHTFATLALTKGVSIESVSSMLGHTNIKTTQIYARITSKKVEDDMKNLAEKLKSFDESNNLEGSSLGDDANKTNTQTIEEPKRRGRPKKRVEVSFPKATNKIVEQTNEIQTKKRGRPKKAVATVAPEPPVIAVPKKRGRPRKVQAIETTVIKKTP